MRALAAFIAGALFALCSVGVATWRVEAMHPPPPNVPEDPVRVVRLVDLRLSQPMADKATSGKFQRWTCEPLP